MKLTKNRETEENREFWDSVERTTDEVRETFPTWKMSEQTAKRFKVHSREQPPQTNNGAVKFD